MADPPGMSMNQNIQLVSGRGEPSFLQQLGEFVDLNKLLPKDRLAALNGNYTEDSRMEWVQRKGGMFLVPAKRESRINGFRKWEQAFRLYASI